MPVLRSRRSMLAVAALALAALAAALLVPAGSEAGRGGKHAAPSVLALPDGWQPEGIARGRGRELFVGSIPTGRVLRLDARTGRQRVVVPARDGRAAIGLKHDHGRLFVAGGPTGRAFVYDARTGDDIVDVELTEGPTFVNDVTVTRQAAWFTDSRRRQLYRLPLGPGGAPADSADTVPITGDLRYDDDPETFEANGIVATPDGGTLLVVQSRNGRLFRVDPATGASREVALRGGDGQRLANGDGLLLHGRTLYAVQNRLNRIAVVRLSPDLRRGRITGYLRSRHFDVPTTVARIGSSLYAPNARFGTDPQPDTEYDVVRVRTPRRGGR